MSPHKDNNWLLLGIIFQTICEIQALISPTLLGLSQLQPPNGRISYKHINAGSLLSSPTMDGHLCLHSIMAMPTLAPAMWAASHTHSRKAQRRHWTLTTHSTGIGYRSYWMAVSRPLPLVSYCLPYSSVVLRRCFKLWWVCIMWILVRSVTCSSSQSHHQATPPTSCHPPLLSLPNPKWLPTRYSWQARQAHIRMVWILQ